MRTLILGLLLTLSLLAGCSNDSPTQPTPSSGFTNFVHFDGPSYLLTKYAQSGHTIGGEIVVNWEACLGEPFTDNDSNGVYNHYIDGFTPTQDINHNGYYDGPGTPYEPGMKFDDLDSNGIYRPFAYDYLYYEPGMPYCDFNGNGQHDSTLPDAYYMQRREIVNLSDSTQRVEFWSVDRYFRFVSDSGFAYELPDFGGVPVQSGLWFLLGPKGLRVHPEYLPDTISFPLAERATLVSADTMLTYLGASADTVFSYLRHSQSGDSLAIDGTWYHNLLHISLRRTATAYGPYDYDYYFSTSLGLLAIRTFPTEHGSSDWLYFDARFTELPIAMKK